MNRLSRANASRAALYGVGSLALFDLDSVRMDSPRLKEIKEHDIQTHHAPHMEDDPWLAIPMKAARAALEGYNLTDDESGSVAGIMAGYCRLLDEAGMTFLGATERDVQDAALAWCRSNDEQSRDDGKKLTP